MHNYNRRTFINYIQIFYDILSILISFLVTVLISYKGNYLAYMHFYLWIPVLFSVVYICIMYILDMYSLTTFMYQDRILRNIMLSCILSYIVCLFMLMFVQPENANKMFFTILILTSLLILICQYILNQEVRKIRNSRWESRVIMIGNCDNIQEYMYYLKKTSFNVNILGYISIDNSGRIPDLEDLGDLSGLNSILTSYTIDEVIFAVHYSKIKDMEPYIIACEERGLLARLALDFAEMNRVKSYIHSVGTIPVLTFHTVVQNNFKTTMKRLFDIVVSSVGLLIMALVSIPIFIFNLQNSSQSVFIKEEFTSLNGRIFKLIRFRADSNKLIGKFLFRTGLNELPQVINVLRGEMSIVGACPTSSSDVEKFTNNEFRRLSIKPGITGLWKLNELRSSRLNYDIATIDEQYIDNWSFLKDCVIIIRTFLLQVFMKAGKKPTNLS